MFDYHNHSNFSDDGTTSIEEMAKAAYLSGLKEFAITDHFDPDYPDPAYSFRLDFEKYFSELERVEKLFAGKMKIIKGMEIGIQHGKTLAACSEAAHICPFDFIIGSFHCAEGFDLFRRDFYEDRSIYATYMAYYQYMCDCLKQYKDYDVIGHFNIIDRYALSIPKDSVYMDMVEEVLKIIIADGKGLEINTSSFRYGLGERTTPSREILRLYRELGGEIITIGSDAHKPADINYRLDYAVEMIKSAGLRYVATFENRRPEYHKIDTL